MYVKDQIAEMRGKMIDEKKVPTASLENEAPKKKKSGCLKWFGIFGSLYILLTLWCQWTPPVKGVVVDSETGKPIQGVEIIRAGIGGHIFAEHEQAMNKIETAKTDEKGCFAINGTLKDVTGGIGFINILPIQWTDTIRLDIYNPGHITTYAYVKIGALGFLDKLTSYGESMEENRVFCESMKFKIKLRSPKTEKDWIDKCDQTLRAYSKYSETYGADEWAFNDLVGYLERFPNGEKAWEYYTKIFSLTGGDYARRDIKDAYLKGKYTKAEVEEICRRNKKLLKIADKVQEPSEYYERYQTKDGTIEKRKVEITPLRQKEFDREKEQRMINLEQRKKVIAELEQILISEENKGMQR